MKRGDWLKWDLNTRRGSRQEPDAVYASSGGEEREGVLLWCTCQTLNGMIYPVHIVKNQITEKSGDLDVLNRF